MCKHICPGHDLGMGTCFEMKHPKLLRMDTHTHSVFPNWHAERLRMFCFYLIWSFLLRPLPVARFLRCQTHSSTKHWGWCPKVIFSFFFLVASSICGTVEVVNFTNIWFSKCFFGSQVTILPLTGKAHILKFWNHSSFTVFPSQVLSLHVSEGDQALDCGLFLHYSEWRNSFSKKVILN